MKKIFKAYFEGVPEINKERKLTWAMFLPKFTDNEMLIILKVMILLIPLLVISFLMSVFITVIFRIS
ncbi:hypothetical protein [Kaistella palustris]|uniref:hypothetical protein n=1 Tax=Kaistella palustris TaxID=493376 RepID=UPI000485F39E|nr:hypothetical protein [Kaistella palustris]